MNAPQDPEVLIGPLVYFNGRGPLCPGIDYRRGPDGLPWFKRPVTLDGPRSVVVALVWHRHTEFYRLRLNVESARKLSRPYDYEPVCTVLNPPTIAHAECTA